MNDMSCNWARGSARIALSSIALVVLAEDLCAQRGRFESRTHGFAIEAPAGWSEIPIKPGEEWILAKFLSDKVYVHNDKVSGTHEHRPMLEVIGFPKQVKRVEETKEETGEGKTVLITIKNPYKSYEDYLDRHHQGGGWFLSADESKKVGALDVRWREVKIEKLTNLPRRILSYEYADAEMRYVVQVDVLESKHAALQKRLRDALESFVFIPKGPPREAAPAAPPSVGWIVGKDEAEMREKLAARRRAWRERALRHVKETLPEGWQQIEDEHFVFLSHASPKFTKAMQNHAKGVRKWLDEEFGDLGNGEVLPSVIRLCASPDEANAYASGSGESYVWDSGEVVCAQGDWILSEFASISWALTNQYLAEKSPAFYQAMPGWLSSGIHSYIGSMLVSKTKGLVFVPNVSSLITVRQLQKEKRLPQVSDFFANTREQMVERGVVDETQYWDVSRYLVRYLLEAPEDKVKFLEVYLRQVMEDLETYEGTEAAKLSEQLVQQKKPMTEEEEDAFFRDQRKRGQDWAKAFEADRRRFLENAFEKAFADWTAKDWEKVQKDFERFVAK
ncbi:MAG: hypothetical protein JNM84_11760 [Planctomycetes bacterium]|nr:hypothetical protein [Planctomycetota bacterium]